MRYLTFALCKGRLAKKTLALLERLGIMLFIIKIIFCDCRIFCCYPDQFMMQKQFIRFFWPAYTHTRVAAILQEVKEKKDAAIFAYTKQFDKADIDKGRIHCLPSWHIYADTL